MSTYRGEEEQIELIKKWWQNHGLMAIFAVLVAIAVVFAWQYYQRSTLRQRNEASLIYELMYRAIDFNQLETGKNKATILMTRYKKTPYAFLATLRLAKINVEQHHLARAIDQLSWLIKHSKDKSLVNIATIRLAKIHIAQHKQQLALKELSSLHSQAYLGLVDDVLGDVYLSLNKPLKAESLYHQALTILPTTIPLYPIVEEKLANLPISDVKELTINNKENS